MTKILWIYGSFSNAAGICLNKDKDRGFAEELADISLNLSKKLLNLKKPDPLLAIPKSVLKKCSKNLPQAVHL